MEFTAFAAAELLRQLEQAPLYTGNVPFEVVGAPKPGEVTANA